MTRIARTLAAAAGIVALGGLAWLALQPVQRPESRASVSGLQSDADTSRYARAYEPRSFRFPDDHSPHPQFQTEWWYYTGNVQDAGGRQYGYQFTIFRRALTPDPVTRTSSLASTQLYFAHFALTDVAGNQHVEAEKFSRGAGGLAGACAAGSATPCEDETSFRAFIENWSVTALDAAGDQVRIVAHHEDRSLDLTLRSLKPAVAHGDRGLSAKSLEPGNASYYYSFTRMHTHGRLAIGGAEFEVTGASWMDHEWSTSALGAGALGWDWFSIQLDDQRELMLFQIRNAGGSLEPASSATWVEADGTTTPLAVSDFSLEPDPSRRWRSPATGAEYPLRWRVRIPSRDLDLTVEARLPDQEMNLTTVYWEGTISVSGTAHGRPVSGQGYLEMTGYAQSINGKF